MPALNFKKEFAPAVEAGEKLQSIRAGRKDGRNPKPGDTLYLYVGQRTRGCRKLGEGECTSVEQICINESFDIYLGGRPLSIAEEREIIRADGFDDLFSFYNFFKKTHGLSFFGLLIKWRLCNNG